VRNGALSPGRHAAVSVNAKSAVNQSAAEASTEPFAARQSPPKRRGVARPLFNIHIEILPTSQLF
jgi:hypothetical protein